MKKHKYVMATLMAASIAAMLAACGGGGGTTPTTTTPLTVGTFTTTANLGNADTWTAPFNASTTSHTQHLYPASSVSGSGKINAISFVSNAASSAISCPSVVVKAAHSNVSSLTTTFASNMNRGSPQTVYSGTVSIPALATGATFKLTLTTPFDYNGVDNLVLDFDLSAACSASFPMKASNTATGDGMFGYPSGSTGTAYPYLPVTTFSFAGGDEQLPLVGSASTNFWPFANTAAVGNEKPRTQNLYLTSEINGSGPITGIAFQSNTTTVAGTYTYSLKLGHSTVTSLGSTYSSNYASPPVTVANAVTFNVPANIPAGGWIWVPIPSGTFTYNGTDNLIIEIATTAGNANLSLSTTDISGRRLWVNDTTGTATTGSVSTTAYNIKLRFNGGQVVVAVAPIGSSGQVLGGTSPGGQIQSLYTTNVIGTSGSIQNVYVHLSVLSTATTLTNYKLYMGHTAKTTYLLSDTYASNMNENATVMSGTLTIPAGLVAGDWIKIPLSTPFTYDSTKNLSILFTSNLGSAGNNTVSTSIVGASVGRNDNAVTSSGTPSWSYGSLVDLKLDIVK